MARKRLNTHFLTIAGIVLGVAGLGLVAAWKILPKFVPQVKWIIRGTPTQHHQKAQALYEQGDYEKAAEAYKMAMQLKGAPDAVMYTGLGDCYSHMVYKDVENLRLANACYGQAVGIDPTYMPALQRMLEQLQAEAENAGRGPQIWEAVASAANKVLAVNPQDANARKLIARAVIQRWIGGIETSHDTVDDAVKSLLSIQQQDNKFDSEAVFYVLIVQMNRGIERLKQTDRVGATALFDNTLTLLDEALKAHPESAALHYRAAMMLRNLGMLGRTEGQTPKYADRVKEEYIKAASLVKSDEPLYSDIKLSLGKTLEQGGDSDGAEKVYRALLTERPDEMVVRITLAELLTRNPAKRKQAIEMLESAPPADPKKFSGWKALIAKNADVSAMFTLMNAKLDMVSSDKTSPQSQELIKQAEALYSKLSANPGWGDTVSGLQARGRLELAKGNAVQAKNTLDRAYQMLGDNPKNQYEAEQKYRVMFMLAAANLATEQTGAAKDLLIQLVRADPKYRETRLMLTQLLIREASFEDAKPHIEELAKQMPDRPEVVARLRIFTYDKVKEKDKITAAFDSLPQKTREELMEKAQMAIYVDRKDEAAKLLEAARSMNPNDLMVVAALSRVYSDLGDIPRASSLLEDAIAKNPNQTELKVLLAQLSGGDVVEASRDMIKTYTDPLRKALALHDLAVREGNQEEAKQHLAEAIQINPTDRRVLDLQFRYALSARDWSGAVKFIDQLAKINADQANGVFYRVRLALAKGDLKEASDLASQLTSKNGEFAQTWVVLGQVQRTQNKPADALASYELALQKQPNNLDAVRGAIDACYSMNDPAKAFQYIATGRKLWPSYSLLKELELQHFIAYGEPEKAIAPREESLAQAIARKDPTEPQARLALGATYLAVAKAKDNPQQAKPLLEKARDVFKEAIAKYPDEGAFTKFYVDALVQLKDVPTAEKAIQDLAARDTWKTKPDATLMLASLYARSDRPGDKDKQQQVLRDYLAKSPQTPAVQIQLAGLLARQNKLDEALKILEPNADEPSIRRQRIELQLGAGKLREAETEIAGALAATPNPSPVLFVRQAYVLMQSGRATQALDVLNRVIKENPDYSEARFYRAQLYVAAKKNLDQAIQELQSMRDLPGNEIQSRSVLAEAYHYSGDDDSAARELEDLIKSQTDAAATKAARLRLLTFYTRATPPRWNQADKVIAEARKQPVLAGDVDLMRAEAQMWLQRNDPAKAGQVVAAARQIAPNDMNLFRIGLEVQFQAKAYQQLISGTDAMAKDKKAPWWVYQYRGKAKRLVNPADRAAAMASALEELTTGIDVATNTKDDEAAAALIQTIVEDIGAQQAIARIFGPANNGNNRYRLMLSYVYQKDGDSSQAIEWVEKVLTDSNATPDDLATARRMAGAMYLQLSPPNVAKAVESYRKLLERDPNDPVALNNLACTMILPNSGYTPHDAIKYSQQAYLQFQQRGEVNPYIYDTQGYMLVLTKRPDEGIQILQQAVDKEPIPEACYHLGEAYLALPTPNKEAAEAALKQAATTLDAATKDNKPLDAELKSKIDKALDRAKQLAPAKP